MYKRTLEENRLYMRAWRKAHPDYNRQKQKEFKLANPGYNYAQVKAWRRANPGSRRNERSRRRAIELQSIPRWLTEEQRKAIRDFYKHCPEGHEVDHIIPLQGKEVRGLHVHWNLQYLTSQENRSKGNRVE